MVWPAMQKLSPKAIVPPGTLGLGCSRFVDLAELERQEFWGLLLAHYLMRKMMAQAAGERGIDPETLSYDRSIEIIKSAQGCPTLETSKRVRNAEQANAISRIGEAKTVSGRGTSKERTIRKKPRPSFPVRKASHKAIA